MKSFNSLLEDLYTSEYKIKKWVDPVTGETKERKIRPKRIDFEASALRGQPAQKETEGLNMKESFKGTPSVKTNHYSWGTMKTIHSGSDFNIPLHPEHHEAIAKLQDEQEHHFKTEDGKHWSARRKGAEVHFQGANGGQHAVVSHASMREATEEDLRNELHEVLSADAKAGDWIHDFVHSTNPKFAGKSKKERIKMALGAYYGKQNKKNKISEAKDPHEYGYEGDMAMNQLKTLVRCAEMIEDCLKPDTDLPEWVQSKITLATDYIQTAADYLYSESEMNEELKGGQKKLDKNHNGKLDSQDFKILRFMKKRKEMQEEKKQYAGLEKEPKKGLPTALVKTSKNAVDVDTVEGWDDPHKAVKESVQKVDVPAYLRKAKGDKPLELKDLKRKDTISDAENLKKARGVKEGVSFADFKMMLEARTQYVVKLSHPDSGHTMLKNYTADKGEDDYDIKNRARVEHGHKGYTVDSVRKKDIDAYDSEDDENAEKSSTTKRGRGRPAGAKSGARGPRIK